MELQPFLKQMFMALGKDEDIIIEKQEDIKHEPIPIKQEIVFVHLMDSDMKDNFYCVGNKDLLEVVKKFQVGDYSYSVGGVFGSLAKVFNEGKPTWTEAFNVIAKPTKKKKDCYFIDVTNPKETIDEVAKRLQVDYPDLIIGL